MTDYTKPAPVTLPPVTECRSCHAKIRWVTTDRRRMPINAEPDPDRGNVVVLADGHALVLGHEEAVRRRAEGLYLSHFATCEQSGDWRKKWLG